MQLLLLFQDLEAYGNSYTGLARLYRLMYIADHCPTLRIEALKMAISYVMCTYNVALYQQLHKKLQEAAGWVCGSHNQELCLNIKTPHTAKWKLSWKYNSVFMHTSSNNCINS
jgi:hypothetical protein